MDDDHQGRRVVADEVSTVIEDQKISSAAGGLRGPLVNLDHFSTSAMGIGDLDGEGIPDLMVGV